MRPPGNPQNIDVDRQGGRWDRDFFSIFLFCVFCEIGRIQEVIPFLAKIHFQVICWGLSIFGLLVSRIYMERLKRSSRTLEFKAILFLLFMGVVTIPFSIWPGYSYENVITWYWKSILFFILVTSYIGHSDSIGKMLWAFVGGCVFLGISALTMMRDPIRRLSIENSYDPNDLAFVMVLAVPYVFFNMLRSSRQVRIVLLGCLGLLLSVILKTQSRGGLLSLIAVVLVSLYYLRKINHHYFVRALFYCCGGVLFFIAMAGAEYWVRMATLSGVSEDYNIAEPSGRIAVWKRGIEILMSNPIVGVGIGNFVTAEGRLLMQQGGSGKWSAAHNSFLQIGAELGLPGLLAFCLILASSLRFLKGRISKTGVDPSNRRQDFIAPILMASWAGYIVGGFFLGQAYANGFYFLAGVSSAFRLMPRVTGKDQVPLGESQQGKEVGAKRGKFKRR